MGEIVCAGEEPHKRPALLRCAVADCPAQHWILGLKCIEDRSLRDRAINLEFHLSAHARQRSQMGREINSYHGNVWTSTERTAGRSWTMAVQVSPLLADAYTCPPLVPKYTPHESSESTAIASRNTFT